MFWRFRRSFVTWCLVAGLLPSWTLLTAGCKRREGGAMEGKPSVAGSKGDFVMGVVPPNQSPAAVASVPRQGKIMAVVIGVGKFQHPGIRSLRYPAKDAEDFSAWLQSVAVPASEIMLLTDAKATFKAVNGALVQWLRERSTSRFDDVVLFFSGHGVKDEQLYWLMHDSELRNLDATALRRDLLQKNLDRLHMKNKLLFVDACYSRASSTPPGSQDMIAQKKNQLLPGEALRGFGGQGSFSLFSSDGDQESLEPATLGNGLFTHWLLRGLKGEADASKDAVLTATELYSFVAANVRHDSVTFHKRPQDPAQDDKTVGGQLALLRFPSAAPPTPVASASSSGSSASQGTRLRVESTPAGASIYLDGAKEGQTPWEAEVEPGRRTLELKLDGYSPVKEVLRLRKHPRRTESYTLRATETPAPREEPAPVPAPREEPSAVVPPPRPRTPQAGDRQTFEAKGQTFKVRYIPAGSFTMGSPDDEKERGSYETQRNVRITKGFWMLETEVTQAQYTALVGSNPSRFSSCGDSCPVEQVSWHAAAAFANKLSAQQSLPSCFPCKEDGTCDIPDKAAYLACKGWRLPTEAEWEYAARAGTTTRFHTGDCITPDQANFHGDYPPEGCSKGEYREKPVAVRSFQPNAWGLYDMHGNVWEWVADWYSSRYESNDLENPLQLLGSDPSKRSDRVERGGSWNHFGRWLRSAYRVDYAPANRSYDLGFRLSRSL